MKIRQDQWQIKAVNRMLEGLDDVISFWHICYGSVDAQTDVWEDKAAEMMPMCLSTGSIAEKTIAGLPQLT